MKACCLPKLRMERMGRLWSFRREIRKKWAEACIEALKVQAKGSCARAHISELQIRLFYTAEDRQSPLGGSRWSPCQPAREMQILSVHKSLPSHGWSWWDTGIREHGKSDRQPIKIYQGNKRKEGLRTPLIAALREYGRALTEHRSSRGGTRAHCMKQPVHTPSRMQLQTSEATIAVSQTLVTISLKSQL